MNNIKLFVNDAIELYNKGHYITSLALICCAIDACAKIKYNESKNNVGIRKWVNENIVTISSKGLPAIFGKNCKFKFGEIANLKKDIDGYSGIEDVIYYLIRCSLIHECDVSSSIILVNRNIFMYDDNKIIIPNKIIEGLIEVVREQIERFEIEASNT